MSTILKFPTSGIASGGPPADNDDMEARIDKLESAAVDTRDRLTRVESKLDHIGSEVGNFKWWVLGAVLTMIVTVIATSVGIQQMTVATFQAAVAHTQSPAMATPIIINVPPPAPASNIK